MKKSLHLLLLFVLAVAIALSMSACNKDKDNDGDDNSGTPSTEECEHVFDTEGSYKKSADGHWYECTKGCGAKYKLGQHVYGDPVITKDSTCTELGVSTRICTVCDYANEQTIKMKKHTAGTSFEYNDESAPGKHWVDCTVCGTDLNIEAHDYAIRGFDKDNHWLECKCGKKSDVVNHAWDAGVPNPDNDGTKLVTCTADGCTASKVVSDENHEHTYTEQVITDSTCSELGLKSFTCNCGDSYNETISMKPHDYDGAWEHDATHHWQNCGDCGAKAPAENKELHDFSGNPTTDGYNKIYTCECGETKTEATGGGYIDPEGWT